MVKHIPAAAQQVSSDKPEVVNPQPANDAAEKLAAALTDMDNAANTLRKTGAPEHTYAGIVKDAASKVKDEAIKAVTGDKKAALRKEHYKSMAGTIATTMIGVFGVSMAIYAGAGAGNALSRKMFKSDFAPMPSNTPTV